MQKMFILLCLALASLQLSAKGYEISVDFDGIASEDVLLAYHYGDKQYIVDTFSLDTEGITVMSADTVLPAGMYMIVFPSLEMKYFEFIVDEQKFSINGEVSDLVGTLEFKGSKENNIMYGDLRFVDKQRKRTEQLNAELAALEQGTDERTRKEEEIQEINESVRKSREKLSKDHPELLYTKVVLAVTEPDIPDAPILEDGTADPYFQWNWIREHAFDNVDWNDERLLRSPAFYTIIYRYLNNYTYRVPDSVVLAVDHVLKQAEVNKEVYRFTLIWLLNEYANSSYMGMDRMYCHLALEYYDKGKAWWIDEAQKFKIVDEARRMMPTLIGNTAPNIAMKDLNGRTRSLYDVEAKYTILFFWDPDCSHCRKETPALKKVVDSIGATYDIKVFTVNTQYEVDKWLKFIDQRGLGDWYNVMDFDQNSNFRALYHIKGTPVLYLLDSEKKIIAKRLGADQLGDFLRVRESGKSKEAESD